MQFSARIDGLDEARARLQKMRAATADLSPALLRAGVAAMKAAQDRIDQQGPGWAPNITETPLLHKTGRLLSSLTVGGADSIEDIRDNAITVGTNVFYARWLQVGTGIYGPGGEPIRPQHAKALFFDGHFARSVRGTPPRPYLFIDQKLAETIRDIFARHVLGESLQVE